MRFETTLFQTGNNTGIEVPSEVLEELGGGKRPAVNVTVNGYEYRSTIAPMGGRFLIPFSSDKRAATGLAGGDPITVELSLDTAPRTVDVPARPGGRARGGGGARGVRLPGAQRQEGRCRATWKARRPKRPGLAASRRSWRSCSADAREQAQPIGVVVSIASRRGRRIGFQ